MEINLYRNHVEIEAYLGCYPWHATNGKTISVHEHFMRNRGSKVDRWSKIIRKPYLSYFWSFDTFNEIWIDKNVGIMWKQACTKETLCSRTSVFLSRGHELLLMIPMWLEPCSLYSKTRTKSSRSRSSWRSFIYLFSFKASYFSNFLQLGALMRLLHWIKLFCARNSSTMHTKFINHGWKDSSKNKCLRGEKQPILIGSHYFKVLCLFSRYIVAHYLRSLPTCQSQ